MFSSLNPDFHQSNKIPLIGSWPRACTLKTRLHVFCNKLSWLLSGKVLLLVFELLHVLYLYCDISWYLATI